MTFSTRDGIRFYSFELFPPALAQAIFTRHGGVSPAPWDSLNVGGTVGDEVVRVRENRARSFSALRRAPESIFDVWQVHSADAVQAEEPRHPEQPPAQADIILTDNPGVTLYMRFADCVPLLLHDPRRGVVALAHAGWQGTVRGAAAAAVRAMREGYGSNPQDILAGIGPSIGPDHYEVGPEVISQVKQALSPEAEELIESRSGRTYLDLWRANRMQLEAAGVGRIETAGLCTACHLEDWYSYRLEKPKTGRFGALIALA